MGNPEKGIDDSLERHGHSENREAMLNKIIDLNSKKKVEELSKNVTDLRKELGSSNPELTQIQQALNEGKIESPSELREAERRIREIAISQTEKDLKKVTDRDEDEVMGLTKEVIGFMKASSTTDIIQQIHSLKEAKQEQEKHKRELEALKSQSPRAFKAYLKAAKAAANEPAMLMNEKKTRKGILKDVKETFKSAIKAPSAVQGEFFKLVENSNIKKESFEEILAELEKKYEQKIAAYEKLLDNNVKIFGEKPAKEFKNWIRDRKSFSEIDFAQRKLENQYIPERKAVQKEFEDMPKALTKDHQKSWERDLGYSERKALLSSLKQLEHQQENPLAKEHLQQLTKAKKEIAPKEWAKMMQEFLQHNFQDQETLLKAFHLTELKKRQEIAKRFENLSPELQDANKDFFTLDLEEKIALLKALEKESAGEDSTQAWEDVLDTDQGRTTFAEKLHIIMGTNKGKGIQLADILAQKTIQDQRRSGKITAADRQEANMKAIAGEETADRLGILHDITDDQITVDAKDGKEKEIHTMDLFKLEHGSMEETGVQEMRRELREEGVTNQAENRYSRAAFVQREGQRELDFTRNTDQRDQMESMVKEMLIDALMMAVESMGGTRMNRESFKDLSEERSQQMLEEYRKLTKQQFHGLEGITKAA